MTTHPLTLPIEPDVLSYLFCPCQLGHHRHLPLYAGFVRVRLSNDHVWMLDGDGIRIKKDGEWEEFGWCPELTDALRIAIREGRVTPTTPGEPWPCPVAEAKAYEEV